MTQPAALIFDMDGVLVDTIDYHYLAWQKVAEAGGIAFSRRDMDHLRGRSRLDCLRYLFRGSDLSQEDIDRYFAVKDRQFNSSLLEMTSSEILPGVLPLLEEARASGLKLGVASSSTFAKRILKQIGLLDSFDAIADAYTVTRPKPEPDIFIWVAGALRASLEEVIVLEDAKVGVEAAQTVGIFTVGLGQWEIVGDADLWAESLADLDWAAILDAFKQARQGVPDQA